MYTIKHHNSTVGTCKITYNAFTIWKLYEDLTKISKYQAKETYARIGMVTIHFDWALQFLKAIIIFLYYSNSHYKKSGVVLKKATLMCHDIAEQLFFTFKCYIRLYSIKLVKHICLINDYILCNYYWEFNLPYSSWKIIRAPSLVYFEVFA